MGRAISQDLLARILAMMLSGSSCRAAARYFGVGEGKAIHLLRLYCATGGITSRQGAVVFWSGKLEGLREFIIGMVKDKGVAASVSCVWIFCISREHYL